MNKEELERLKKMVEDVVKMIVDNEDAVVVKMYEATGSVIEVIVKKEDYGRVIGKKGRIAQALRVILGAIGGKYKERIMISFLGEEDLQAGIDNGYGRI